MRFFYGRIPGLGLGLFLSLHFLLAAAAQAVLSNAAGLATLPPATGGAQGAIVIQGAATTENSIVPFRPQSLSPVAPPESSDS
jgi:hypothetical protein